MATPSETLNTLVRDLLDAARELDSNANKIAIEADDHEHETLRFYLGGDCDEVERLLAHVRRSIPEARPEEDSA